MISLNQKDWNKIDMTELEKEWKSGDEQAELEEEYEHQQRIAQKMSQNSMAGYTIELTVLFLFLTPNTRTLALKPRL